MKKRNFIRMCILLFVFLIGMSGTVFSYDIRQNHENLISIQQFDDNPTSNIKSTIIREKREYQISVNTNSSKISESQFFPQKNGYSTIMSKNKFGLSLQHTVYDATELRYQYDFDLPADMCLKFLYTNDSNDGSVGLFDTAGNLIDGFILSDIIDANQVIVPSSITINHNTITRTLYPNDKNIFPISLSLQTLSSTSYDTYFSDSYWINRSDGVALSVYINKNGWQTGQGSAGASVIKQAAWGFLANRHRGDSNWYNEEGLEKQFRCHAEFAGNKQPWNLEPWRSNSNYAWTVLKGCNP